jgi:hypothetical protein
MKGWQRISRVLFFDASPTRAQFDFIGLRICIIDSDSVQQMNQLRASISRFAIIHGQKLQPIPRKALEDRVVRRTVKDRAKGVGQVAGSYALGVFGS